MFKRLTPVLIVEAIEPVIPFWKALGFEQTISVPHGQSLGFAAFEADGIEVMVQTIESVRGDHAAVLEGTVAMGASALFLEVMDLAAITARIPGGTDILIAGRQTFYGTTETIVRDPAGNVITFAQMA